MTRLLAVLVLTISQFTAFPFVAMIAANTARHDAVQAEHRPNVTIVYKTGGDRGYETL